MDNTNLNAQAKPKKKSRVWAVIRSILIFVLGLIIGSGSVLLIVLLIVGLTIGLNKQKYDELTAQSDFLNSDTLSKIDQLEKYIRAYYYEDVEEKDLENGLYYGIMNGVGDPYTVYYSPEEYKDMTASWNGNYEGIGAYLKMDTDVGYAQIESFIEGGSAKESGELKVGDYIVAVDGMEMYGKTLNEVVSYVRGEEGTFVTLTVEGTDGKRDVTLERRKIDTPTVEYSEKDNGIWYIKITEFDAITTSQFEEAINAARDADMKGLIIDLRGNPGGNLDVVVDICRELLPKGLIVYTEDKYGNRNEFSCDGKNEIDVPLAVLIDGGSASASEIMAGAIKDYGIGTLIGTTTYGKGIVQSILPLGDGSAIKITTSKYYTPNGNNIHKIGIEPDEEVTFDSEKYLEDETDNQLDYALDFVKKQIK
ncbi:MAG: S41 family peptidase [Lachnospiraceae bacterium]|nr:S41 family peptidase [Lachnospiraceae bacterium]